MRVLLYPYNKAYFRDDDLINSFRENRKTSFTNYEIVEAMMLFGGARKFESFKNQMERVRVDGHSNNANNYRCYTQVYELNDSLVIKADEDFMWKFFLLPVEMPL